MSDAIVVGGGLSGLAAAHLLERSGCRVTVVEARERLGGRIHTIEVAGERFDAGAQWIGPGQTRVDALAGALGLDTFPTRADGPAVVDVAGRRTTMTGSIPRLGPLALVRLQAALWALDRRAGQVAPTGAAGRDVDRDRRTLAEWLDATWLDRHVRDLVVTALRVVLGAEPSELSLLQVLQYVRAAGSVMALTEVEGGAQERRFVGGAGSLVAALADRLDAELRLGAPVERIAQDPAGPDEVTVHCAGGESLTASTAIVAVPPNLVPGIAFTPALPHARRRWLDRVRMGTTIKCLAVYDRPVWRDRGWSGEAVATAGPLSYVVDNTAPGGRPALVGFAVAAPGRWLQELPPAAQRRAVAAHLADLLGPAAGTPAALHLEDWSQQPFTGGCPVALPAPGATATASAAGLDPRAPHGRVHWAGTELATSWRGYMEGAIESGQRAAREVVAGLEADDDPGPGEDGASVELVQDGEPAEGAGT